MNLHQIVSGVVSSVNPMQPVTLQSSTGYVTNPDGSRVPSYAPPITNLPAQVQELTTRDLRQLEGLNIQGSGRAIYMNGIVNGVVRVSKLGGDLITLQDGSIWLTTSILELWDTGWVKCSITLQDGS